MTQSTRNGKSIPRRVALHKFVRQKAHQEGILFNTAVNNTVGPAGLKASYSSYHFDRRLPLRTDDMQWKSGDFISGSAIDDGELFIHEADSVYDINILMDDTCDTRHHTDMTISLLEIARPAKRKGIAKDFEVVQKVRNVIVLEDEFEGLGWEDDEWEQIYDERHADQGRSYSSVLRTKRKA